MVILERQNNDYTVKNNSQKLQSIECLRLL